MSDNANRSQQPAPSGCLAAIARWILPILVFGGVMFFVFIVAMILLAANVGNLAEKLKEKNAHDFTEKIVKTGDSKNRIALISVNGEIGGAGNYLAGEGTVYEISRKLRAAADDETVKAVLLCVDSPGGGLTAGDVLHNEIQRVQERGKKVIAHFGNLAASGGYYISAPVDYIVAQPTCLIGSFGVIMFHFEVDELAKKIGVRVDPVKSTGSKDMGSIFRPMSEAEKKFFEKILGVYHQRFIDIIASGRKIPVDKVKALATGEIYTAVMAKDAKLIDEIGYFDDALNYTIKTIANSKPEVFIYEEGFDFEKLFNTFSSATSVLKQFLPVNKILQLK